MNAMKWMMTLTLATALGCGSPVGKDNNDPDPDPDPHDYQEITFLVTNDSLSSVFVDQTKQVVTIYHGNDAYSMGGLCAQPDTENRSSALEVAGVPANNAADAAPIPPMEELRPGEQWSRLWNGIVQGEGDCPNLDHLLGEELVVEFCYGTNIEGSDEWSAFPTNLECARQSFTHTDEPTTVEISIDTEIEEGDTMPIIVENNLDNPIFLQLVDNCGGGTFYSVTHNGEEIGLSNPCGPCDCSQGTECAIACDASCEAPSVVSVDSGTTFEHPFSLTYRKPYDEGTHQCTQLQHVPVGPLTATICYGLDADLQNSETPQFGTIVDEVCETLTFSTTDEELRLVVQ